MFRSAQEEGSIESFLVFIPILLTSVVALSLFQFGITSNALAGDATLVGRALARYPESADFEGITEQVLSEAGDNGQRFSRDANRPRQEGFRSTNFSWEETKYWQLQHRSFR